MVKVKYIPESGTPDQTETLGLQWDANEPTEVTDKAKLEVLRGNPFFEVQDEEGPSRSGRKKTESASAPVQQGNGALSAELQPDGTYAIIQNGAAINHPALSKEEADAFNQLTDADKAEYIKA